MRQRPAELLRALAVLGEPPGPEHARVATALALPGVPDNAGYADVFLFQLYPYASVYLGPEGMMGGEAADRIAGFWTALGRVPPKEPDHLSALLALYADLVEPAAEADSPGLLDGAESVLRHEAAEALMNEHLSPWVFAYLERMSDLVPGFYGAWAELLMEVLVSEVGHQSESAALAVHLSAAEPVQDPRAGEAVDFVGALLAPARSGLILTRADLGTLAAALDLGLRAGERRYALEHLLGADPARVLQWLGAEAHRQGERHANRGATRGAIGTYLADRALGTAMLCEALALESAASDAAAPEALPA